MYGPNHSTIPSTRFTRSQVYLQNSRDSPADFSLHANHIPRRQYLHTPNPIVLLQHNPILILRIQRTRRAILDTLRHKSLQIHLSILRPCIPPQIQYGNEVQRPVDHNIFMSLDVSRPGYGVMDLVRIKCECGEAEECYGCLAEDSCVRVAGCSCYA